MAANTIDITDALSKTNFSPISGYSVQSLATTAVNLILVIGTAASFFFLLWGAVQWIFSGGDKEGLEKARKKITAALIGLAILFSLFALGFLVNAVFKVDIFNLCIPSLTSSTCVSSSGSGTTGCEKDVTGACNPACCRRNSQCPSGQKCNISNEYCLSGLSCNPSP